MQIKFHHHNKNQNFNLSNVLMHNQQKMLGTHQYLKKNHINLINLVKVKKKKYFWIYMMKTLN